MTPAPGEQPTDEDPYHVDSTEQLAELVQTVGSDTLTVKFGRGENMYGNDRFSYGFTSTDIARDWKTIVQYARHFNGIIDSEIQKRTDIKNNQPKRPRGRPPNKAVAPTEEAA